LSTTQFAFVNIVLIIVWLAVAVRIGLEYKTLVAEGRSPC